MNWIIRDQYPILYCLSVIVPGVCRLQIHIWLFLIVVVINTAKVVCLLVTFKEQNGTPLITVGDAIASFLDVPCLESRGLCLTSEKEVLVILDESATVEDKAMRKQSVQFRPKNLRYHDASSFFTWAVYISLYVWLYTSHKARTNLAFQLHDRDLCLDLLIPRCHDQIRREKHSEKLSCALELRLRTAQG